LPSIETIRYRPASRVPGTNRLSLREDAEELATRDGPLTGVLGDDRGVEGLEAATVRVAKTSASASTGRPQVEQKRLAALISLAQDGHVVMAASHDRTRAARRCVIQLAA
jgi:hypothetical protein